MAVISVPTQMHYNATGMKRQT